jgi:glycosyltransferase involved in cell wall biosynthesis
MFEQHLISVGIPVYNGEKTIARCLNSILSQTHRNLEIIISDNNSDDRTFEICRFYAELDSRVVLIRQETNIGPAGNFAYVFEKSRGKYFCWVASDDMRSADFLEHNLRFLEMNPLAAASTSPHIFISGSVEAVSGKPFSLSGSLTNRVLDFLRDPWSSHALFYSLYRRDSLCCFPKLGQNFLGWDWAIVFYVLRQGNMNRIHEGLISLQTGGQSDRSDALRMSGVKGIKYIYPLSNFVHFVLLSSFKHKPSLVVKEFSLLCKLNLRILKYEYSLLKHKLRTFLS